MTKARIERIVELWRKRLGLHFWQITIDWSDLIDPAEASARTWHSHDYDVARIRFARDYASWSPAAAEQTVVHELCHLLHRDLDRVIASLDEQVHRDVWLVTDKRYSHELEGFVDRLASSKQSRVELVAD